MGRLVTEHYYSKTERSRPLSSLLSRHVKCSNEAFGGITKSRARTARLIHELSTHLKILPVVGSWHSMIFFNKPNSVSSCQWHTITRVWHPKTMACLKIDDILFFRKVYTYYGYWIDLRTWFLIIICLMNRVRPKILSDELKHWFLYCFRHYCNKKTCIAKDLLCSCWENNGQKDILLIKINDFLF